MRCAAMRRMSNASMQIAFMLKMNAHMQYNHRLKVIAGVSKSQRDKEWDEVD